jgi:hypothetical protein
MHNFQMRLSLSSIVFSVVYIWGLLCVSLLLDFIFTFSKGTTLHSLFLHKYLTEGIISIGIPFFRPIVESR